MANVIDLIVETRNPEVLDKTVQQLGAAAGRMVRIKVAALQGKDTQK